MAYKKNMGDFIIMDIDDMIYALENYFEEAGFEGVKEKYLSNKSLEEILILYNTAFEDFNKK